MRSGLPLLLGIAVTFALVASLAPVGGAWVVQLNQYGRWIALVFVALFGLTLLLPRLADRLTRPWWRPAVACPKLPATSTARAPAPHS